MDFYEIIHVYRVKIHNDIIKLEFNFYYENFWKYKSAFVVLFVNGQFVLILKIFKFFFFLVNGEVVRDFHLVQM